ncbi:hypothetical protein KI688_008011 [Linnemannia hyalina]|uniref:Kazal-like domain-containing protein n=1 Tax=Linnemannia hyalina TaxID=64524 RepID=A0A9P7Y038_9FUNG|nr:hypothetical protein KI688_008011 [Linnemannia hyalina]
MHYQAGIPTTIANLREKLLNFGFECVYRPGMMNIIPDALSRAFPEEHWTNTASETTIKLGSRSRPLKKQKLFIAAVSTRSAFRSKTVPSVDKSLQSTMSNQIAHTLESVEVDPAASFVFLEAIPGKAATTVAAERDVRKVEELLLKLIAAISEKARASQQQVISAFSKAHRLVEFPTGSYVTLKDPVASTHPWSQTPAPLLNFVLVADSSCKELAAPTCNTVCPAIYQHVCGKVLSGDFKTFGNYCELKNYNCEHANAQATVVPNNLCAFAAVEKRAPADAAPAKCNDIVCAALEQPVYVKAKNGLNKTFGNASELKKYNCKHPDAEFVVIAESTCEVLAAPKCDIMCVMVEDPVCATSKDGKTQTFNNACLLDVHNCQNPTATFKLVASAACPATLGCADACPAVYQPVCAKLQSGKSKTFGNQCELSAFNCMNPKAAFTFASEGAC